MTPEERSAAPGRLFAALPDGTKAEVDPAFASSVEELIERVREQCGVEPVLLPVGDGVYLPVHGES